MSAWSERWYPRIAGLAGGTIFFFLAHEFPVKAENAPNLFSAIISVAAISVGFLATASSILLSIEQKPIIVKLKEVGTYPKLIDYLFEAVGWSLALAVVSISCFLADLKSPDSWHRWLFAFWVGVIVGAGTSFFRVVHNFTKILRSAD